MHEEVRIVPAVYNVAQMGEKFFRLYYILTVYIHSFPSEVNLLLSLLPLHNLNFS